MFCVVAFCQLVNTYRLFDLQDDEGCCRSLVGLLDSKFGGARPLRNYGDYLQLNLLQLYCENLNTCVNTLSLVMRM
jgi:hypothetical protein